MWWALALTVLAQSDDGPTETQLLIGRTGPREYVDQLLEDGRHTRFGTDGQGPVHVWRPATYRRETASTIVYLHGFYTNVDSAMVEHQLVTQFRDSARNALFIVPETRSWRTDPLPWKDLEELVATVEKRLKLKRPKGPITVVCHSGGYKNAAEWLAHPELERVVLVDGLYGNDEDFKKWVESGTQEKRHQLVLVGFDTQTRADWFLKKQPVSVKLDELPHLFDELPQAMRSAPVLSLQSERFDHMSLVTSGRLLPWLLHVLR